MAGKEGLRISQGFPQAKHLCLQSHSPCLSDSRSAVDLICAGIRREAFSRGGAFFARFGLCYTVFGLNLRFYPIRVRYSLNPTPREEALSFRKRGSTGCGVRRWGPVGMPPHMLGVRPAWSGGAFGRRSGEAAIGAPDGEGREELT